jgi:L-ascorbate metabolism protein UlaG (beta-lactamase superfamily)
LFKGVCCVVLETTGLNRVFMDMWCERGDDLFSFKKRKKKGTFCIYFLKKRDHQWLSNVHDSIFLLRNCCYIYF